MSQLEEYHQNLLAEIRRDADTSGVLKVEAFFERMANILTEAGELETADRAFYENGDRGQRVRIDGYAGDPRDSGGTLGLIVCDFVDSNEVITFGRAELPPILNPLIRFLKQARTVDFRDSINEVSPGFQISDLIITTWTQVNKVKLILVSNRHYIGRDDAASLSNLDDVPVTLSVWDLARFERFDRSGQAREDMVIDFAGDFGTPLPALKASQAGAALESYLMIVPGEQLAQIYDRWGARLLEANVRSFLQARAKTNKGIQTTIRAEPELFFPYNNGLSATADEVTCVQTKEGLAISSVSNLQIVNGAQTTGSIHATSKLAPENLNRVFVQMKLTVVPPERAEDIVPKISEFANTQNKVNAADFFSNHPFHIRMEQFSRKVIFAAREGERHDSKWFYERSRGQYLNSRSKLSTTQRKNFDLEFPKAQLFSKTDLAKFEHSAAGLPHVVSTGAQKNFAKFAVGIAKAWEQGNEDFNELWYRRLISKALIFRRLEMEVPRQSWYEGGYRANIVTYAMAKVFRDASDEKQVLDLDSIWRRQSVSDALARALMVAAAAAHDVITHPATGIRNMSEWAKQQACWSQLESRTLKYENDFDSCLTLQKTASDVVRDEHKKKKMIDGINAQTAVINVGPAAWEKALTWGKSKKMLTDKDAQILGICASPRKVPSELQAKHAMHVLARLNDQGFEQV